MATKDKLLELLSSSSSHVSGEWISQQLGISRTAVWKAVNRLKQDGYAIESVSNRGYKLVGCSEWITEEGVLLALKSDDFFEKVFVYDTVDSTNNELKRLHMTTAFHSALAIAEEQTAGKGRRGRSWSSVKGDGLWMSLLLKPEIPPYKAPVLTLVAGLAVCEAIEGATGLEAGIKWPNDIVVEGRKVCGILTEMSAEIETVNYVVIGIGINVNQEAFDASLKEMAVSLRMLTGKPLDRMQLLSSFTAHFKRRYAQFLRTKDLVGMLDDYQKRCINIGKPLKILWPEETVEGRGLAVSPSGELVVETDAGVVKIASGEVSVRGIYGYTE